MSYKVRIESFEGPFDLLLYLVSRQKVDINTICISDITDQYLEEISHLSNLDLDVASDFLLVAATLLKIKAESLLLTHEESLDEELAQLSPECARDMLIERLYTYKQYKNAAHELQLRFEAHACMHPRTFGPDREFLHAMPDWLEHTTLDTLGALAARALARREVFLLESKHIAAIPIPVETYVRTIHSRIVAAKHATFSELVEKDASTPVVVVTFLAILELYKRSMVKLNQAHTFGDIQIDYIEGSGELFLNDTDNGNNADNKGNADGAFLTSAGDNNNTDDREY